MGKTSKPVYIASCMGPADSPKTVRAAKTDDDILKIEVEEPEGNDDTEPKAETENDLLYRVDENPPIYLSFVLGFQHYLTMFGATFGLPFVLATPLCFKDNPTIISEVINTIFFASGLATLLQTTLGVRLPIVQGGTYTFVAPTFAIMGIRGSCPSSSFGASPSPTPAVTNMTSLLQSTVTAAISQSSTLMPNGTTSAPGVTASDEEWKIRMREIQGAIMVSSLCQVLIGFSGVMGFIIEYIGPLTIVPTIALVGLPLFEVAYNFAGTQWGISLLMMALVILFSQVLKDYDIPFPTCSKRECGTTRLPVFKLFPIMIAIFVCWMFCAILTVAGAFTDNPKLPSYKARTDARLDVLYKVDWFRVPYPGQWGTPTVSAAAVFGMLAGVIASMIESIGDYFACARLAGAPPPPRHAINRGLGMEGIGCILTGAWGTGNGTTSYSENIGAIGITRVGSRRVVQCGAVIMMVLAVIGKFGALFTTIPDPVIGGIFIIMFGMITAVGLSTLQYADLNSMRNLTVLGVSLFFGLVLPFWLKKYPRAIDTGKGLTKVSQHLVDPFPITEYSPVCYNLVKKETLAPLHSKFKVTDEQALF